MVGERLHVHLSKCLQIHREIAYRKRHKTPHPFSMSYNLKQSCCLCIPSSLGCTLVQRAIQKKRRPAGTTTTAWGGTCEIITLKSGDRRWRNELADRAKRLRILRKYGLAPAEKKTGGGGGRGRGGGGGGGHGGGEYDDDGFEGEVKHAVNVVLVYSTNDRT